MQFILSIKRKSQVPSWNHDLDCIRITSSRVDLTYDVSKFAPLSTSLAHIAHISSSRMTIGLQPVCILLLPFVMRTHFCEALCASCVYRRDFGVDLNGSTSYPIGRSIFFCPLPCTNTMVKDTKWLPWNHRSRWWACSYMVLDFELGPIHNSDEFNLLFASFEMWGNGFWKLRCTFDGTDYFTNMSSREAHIRPLKS